MAGPVFKRLLDREELRQTNGENTETHFVKGAQAVFPYRIMRFMKNNRGDGDLMKWMTRFQIDGRRFEEAWMDLCQELHLNSPPIQAEAAARRAAHNNAQNALHAANDAHAIEPWTNDTQQAVFDEAIGLHRQAHRDLFPLSPNLIALIFIYSKSVPRSKTESDQYHDTQKQNNGSISSKSELRETFIEMLCTVKTAVDNPVMNPSGSGGRRAFLVFEEGDADCNFGYWAEDEEDGAEGFLHSSEDVFGSGMRMTTHGFKEDFKEEEPEKQKEKEDQDEDFSAKKQRKRKRKEKRKKSSC